LRENPEIDFEGRKQRLIVLEMSRPVPKSHKFKYCARCSERINYNNKYCISCVPKILERIKWPENLPELVKQSSKRAVAMKLGISDKSVAKRLKRHHK
jgi:hypothetical protein